MSSKRVKRKAAEPPPVEKPSKEEYAVAKYIKDHVPGKKTKFMHHPVQYFTAARAVDALLDSPWASGDKKHPIIFTDRQSVVVYLDMMLRHKFFHRAKKIAISDRDLRRKELKKLKKKEEQEQKKKKDESESESEEEEKDGKKEEEAGDRSGAEEAGGEKSAAETETSPKPKKKNAGQEAAEKPKRRIKLDMHLEQIFVDGTDAYIWIYDPIPTHYWLLGALIVFGIVAVCLFPLWPTKVREYVYYLSLAAAGFLVFILALSVLRVIVFALVWLFSMGRHHLWLLPNLTEDVGFFASFWPLYQYEYKGPKEEKKKEKKKKRKEVEGESGRQEEQESLVSQDPEPAAEERTEETTAQDGEEQRESEGGSEGSQQSTSTFEILDKEEEADATP